MDFENDRYVIFPAKTQKVVSKFTEKSLLKKGKNIRISNGTIDVQVYRPISNLQKCNYKSKNFRTK